MLLIVFELKKAPEKFVKKMKRKGKVFPIHAMKT
jgi:hypothetical protein